MGSSQSSVQSPVYSVAIDDAIATSTSTEKPNDNSESTTLAVTDDTSQSNVTRSAIRRNPRFIDELVTRLPGTSWKSAWDIFQFGVDKCSERHCLGQRQLNEDGSFGGYEWLTYQEVRVTALQLGTSLCRKRLCEEKHFSDETYKGAQKMRPMGIFSKNCVEWYITEQAVNACGFTLVPLYDTLGDEAMIHIVNETQLSTIIVSVECFKLLDRVIDDMPTVKSIILLDITPWACSQSLPGLEDPKRQEFNQSFIELLDKYETDPQQESPVALLQDASKSPMIDSPVDASTTLGDSPNHHTPQSPTIDLSLSPSRSSRAIGGESPSRLSPSRSSRATPKLSLFGDSSPTRQLSRALSKLSFTAVDLSPSRSRTSKHSFIAEDDETMTKVYEEIVQDLLPTPKASPKAAKMSPAAALAQWQSFVQGTDSSEHLSSNIQKSSEQSKPVVHLWSSLIEEGKRDTMEPMDVDPDSVQTLCYTSGTTGLPKGVILSHRALVANLSALVLGGFIGTSLELGPEDVHQSYLPLAHIYERIMAQHMYWAGGSIGVFSGDTRKLFDDIKVLRPTCFISVPRIFARLLDQINSKMATRGFAAQQLYHMGVEAKLQNLRLYGTTTHAVYDRLMFGQLNELVFGGRVRFFVCGAAAFDSHLEEMIQVLFCSPLLQGYGLTECLGGVTMKQAGDGIVGHVGGVLPWAEICLESVPEMQCDALDEQQPKGEILVRGPGLSSGYFKKKLETAEVFDADGWFHTGDVGVLLPNGALKIVDRKKNIFKLSQGEYVAPEKIEAVYCKARTVAQIFVYGHSDKDSLVGIVVPDHDAVAMWARTNQREFHDMELLIHDDELNRAIMSEMNEVAKDKLKGFEKVKSIRLSLTPFTLENSLLTPTLKLKRVSAKAMFNDLIEEMYK